MTYNLAKVERTDCIMSNAGSLQAKRELEIAIHPSKCTRLLINYPGFEGDMDGLEGRYIKIANQIQPEIAAVVRSGNKLWNNSPYEQTVKDDLEAVISYSLKNSKEICGSEKPELYLAGFSAGGGAVASLARKYNAKRILLIAPSFDAGEQDIEKGLKEFKGEQYVIIGENDEVISPTDAKRFHDLSAANKKLFATVPGCDHHFTDWYNEFERAYLWAFAWYKLFPLGRM
jgi:dienelactone hydrolase